MLVGSRLSEGPSDAGMSLIEVLVALLVLGVITSGVVAGTLSVVRISQDSRSREVAINLASQELDVVRTVADPYSVVGSTSTWTDPETGRVYTVVRSSAWVALDGTDTSCGVGSAPRLRRITAAVTWTGQLPTTRPVTSATVIAPMGAGNDLSSGAISLRVAGAGLNPRSGVAVGITVHTGSDGTDPARQPAPTDADGCAYVRGLLPGTYDLTISRPGYLDQGSGTADRLDGTQTSTSTTTVTVAAGATVGVQMAFDAWAGYTVSFSSPSSAAPALPMSMTAQFDPGAQSGGPVNLAAVQAGVLHLYPHPGYSAVLGRPYSSTGNVLCASADPQNWMPQNMSGTRLTGGARARAAAGSGAASLDVPVGVVRVVGQKGAYLTAVPARGPSSSGDPGCETPSGNLAFSSAASASTDLALPFGSWTLYSGDSVGKTSRVIAGSSLTAVSNAAPAGVSGNVVTLDPRKVTQ